MIAKCPLQHAAMCVECCTSLPVQQALLHPAAVVIDAASLGAMTASPEWCAAVGNLPGLLQVVALVKQCCGLQSCYGFIKYHCGSMFVWHACRLVASACCWEWSVAAVARSNLNHCQTAAPLAYCCASSVTRLHIAALRQACRTPCWYQASTQG